MYSRDNDSTAARGASGVRQFRSINSVAGFVFRWNNSVLIKMNVRGWHLWVVNMNQKVRRLNQPSNKVRQIFMLAYNKSSAHRIEISLSANCSGHTQERANLGLYIPGWQVPWPLWKQPLWQWNFSVPFLLVKHISYMVAIWRQISWHCNDVIMGAIPPQITSLAGVYSAV